MQSQSSKYSQKFATGATLMRRSSMDPQSSLLGSVHSKRHAYIVRPSHYGTNNFSQRPAEKSFHFRHATAHRERPVRSPFDTKLAPSPPSTSGPIKLVKIILATWKLQPKDALSLLGYEAAQGPYVQDLLNGYGTLSSRDVKDRIACLFEVRRTLSGLFKDKEVENDWLRETHSILNDQKPIDLLLEGSIENLLLVKDYVELVAGR